MQVLATTHPPIEEVWGRGQTTASNVVHCVALRKPGLAAAAPLRPLGRYLRAEATTRAGASNRPPRASLRLFGVCTELKRCATAAGAPARPQCNVLGKAFAPQAKLFARCANSLAS